jgi:hypothetical protein
MAIRAKADLGKRQLGHETLTGDDKTDPVYLRGEAPIRLRAGYTMPVHDGVEQDPRFGEGVSDGDDAVFGSE